MRSLEAVASTEAHRASFNNQKKSNHHKCVLTPRIQADASKAKSRQPAYRNKLQPLNGVMHYCQHLHLVFLNVTRELYFTITKSLFIQQSQTHGRFSSAPPPSFTHTDRCTIICQHHKSCPPAPLPA
ncbi:hypothetical protein DUNSADRAFT_14031 [Dunaliella salina]|uniref:Encoded protein n=1 Tax=Dunaliella salina TaxID=3046 RepID=A0ABQ7H315_DUNSA|nr:hypothetical protein DUNSADRAFT_14031 [Dunaliella salina]|eukprot:KAF5841200.1 hypothetical protein DUNSADRAFT_14031 [Dunaliella salina]